MPRFPRFHSDREESKIHHGRHAIQRDHALLVNAWAFVGEKIIHGQPSGVDNTVAMYGNAVAFTRDMNGRESKFETLQGSVQLFPHPPFCWCRRPDWGEADSNHSDSSLLTPPSPAIPSRWWRV
jgi:hypothetical protein